MRPAVGSASAAAFCQAIGARRRRWIGGLLAAALVLLPLVALAQSSSASYQLPRQSIDAGGARAASASYTLNGTLGQPDAEASMSSASFTVRGGFHLAAAPPPSPDRIFSDGFETP